MGLNMGGVCVPRYFWVGQIWGWAKYRVPDLCQLRLHDSHESVIRIKNLRSSTFKTDVA